MFLTVCGSPKLLTARDLAELLHIGAVSPQDQLDVMTSGRYCVRLSAIIGAMGDPAEPYWARLHEMAYPMYGRLPEDTAPQSQGFERRTSIEPCDTPNIAESPRAPLSATSAKQSADAECFSPLWQWQRLRKLPPEQRRHMAVQWARAVLEAHQDWLLVDTETTGLSSKDQVVELAVGKLSRHLGRWKLEPVLVQRLRPSVPVSYAAAMVHGIRDSDLRSSPTFRDVADKVRSLMHGRRLLAWNASFDKAALHRTAASWQTPPVATDASWHCAMRAHAVWAGTPGNRMLYRYHKLDGDHSALGDINCMLQRLVRMAES
jgi:hypothetical protein